MEEEWRDHGEEPAADGYIPEYDITAVPNDFNVAVIVSFIDSGSIRIPGFQRNFVWDLARSSRLIESLLLGLPVPQVFLYQHDKDPLLLIDGQQRLMTLYYFIKGRFPKRDARAKIRDRFDESGSLAESILADDSLFSDFKLSLRAPDGEPDAQSPFHGKKYATLGDDQRTLDLRTVRNVVIKQVKPTDDHSSMFEVFNRLNSGGVNLSPQELRMSLYNSGFSRRLLKLNRWPQWRHLLQRPEPDVRFKDVEILLRSLALLYWIDEYRPSMVKFLNRFSGHCKRTFDSSMIDKVEILFSDFLQACSDLPDRAFMVNGSSRFNVPLFEVVFAETLRPRLADGAAAVETLRPADIAAIDQDPAFRDALKEGTTKPDKVKARLHSAKSILFRR
ncbi:MAG: DUF262 domain-containing protein [Gemmatimonadota bacterium]|nr:DUF262 domain-containing protein [Gemmatimonadota bacterium]MDE2865973.1 DUF262 domain-containing protein [Gemmatimonadota bacterium]